MFTGIVEEIGMIKRKKVLSSHAVQLDIEADMVLEDVTIGDSIAVNGICLTVTGFTDEHFSVDVMPETMKATSLKNLSAQSSVNLERSMAANGRFGGHFVTGHIDATGTIIKKEARENAIEYVIDTPEHLQAYIIKKGSVAVDGISLTVFGVEANRIQISLIPHTAKETTLGKKGPGDLVNIECDMLLKHVHHLMQLGIKNEPSKLNKDFLQKHGF